MKILDISDVKQVAGGLNRTANILPCIPFGLEGGQMCFSPEAGPGHFYAVEIRDGLIEPWWCNGQTMGSLDGRGKGKHGNGICPMGTNIAMVCDDHRSKDHCRGAVSIV